MVGIIHLFFTVAHPLLQPSDCHYSIPFNWVPFHPPIHPLIYSFIQPLNHPYADSFIHPTIHPNHSIYCWCATTAHQWCLQSQTARSGSDDRQLPPQLSKYSPACHIIFACFKIWIRKQGHIVGLKAGQPSLVVEDPRNLLCRHHHLILAFLAFLLGFLSDLFGKFLLYGIAAFAHVLTRSSWQFLSLNRDHHSHEADFMLTMLSLQPVVLIASSYCKNLSMWPHCLGHNKKLLKILNHPHRFWNIQMPWQRLHIWWRCLLYCACHARRFFADPLQASHAARLPSFLLLLRNFPVLLTSGKVQNRLHLPHKTTS